MLISVYVVRTEMLATKVSNLYTNVAVPKGLCVICLANSSWTSSYVLSVTNDLSWKYTECSCGYENIAIVAALAVMVACALASCNHTRTTALALTHVRLTVLQRHCCCARTLAIALSRLRVPMLSHVRTQLTCCSYYNIDAN